jgi:Type VI secretion system/phage-baseplate injector OB domain
MSRTPLDGVETEKRFFGKYRGLVVENTDPLQIGRVIAQVPDVLGEVASSWALPSVPAAGIQAGCFIVPPIGSQVWIEFERGEPDYPIWTGGFWGLIADVPTLSLAPAAIPPGQNIVLQTTGQNTIALSDAPSSPASGGIILKAASGAMIVVNDAGITISNGKGAMISLVGPIVSVNSDALTVIGSTVSVDGVALTPGP